jgi:hypothetical protein
MSTAARADSPRAAQGWNSDLDITIKSPLPLPPPRTALLCSDPSSGVSASRFGGDSMGGADEQFGKPRSFAEVREQDRAFRSPPSRGSVFVTSPPSQLSHAAIPTRTTPAREEPRSWESMVAARSTTARTMPSSAALLRHELTWKSYGRDSIAIGEGGLLATKVAQESWDLITSGQALCEGRHYWEVEIAGADMGRFFVGVTRPHLHPHGDYALMECRDAWFVHAGDGSLWGNGRYADDAAGSCEQGDRVGVLLDLDGGSLLFFRNGVQHGQGFPAGSVTGPVLHALQIGDLNESGRLVPLAHWPAGHAWKANVAPSPASPAAVAAGRPA